MMHPSDTILASHNGFSGARQVNHLQPLDDERVQQLAEMVLVVGPAVVTLAQQMWDVVASQRRASRDRDAAQIEEETRPPDPSDSVPEVERSTLARALTYVGEMLYDYSGGAYGIKPPPIGMLRRARKQAEREVRAAARAAETSDRQTRRNRLIVPLAVLGVLGGLGAVTLAILQREQLRAATTQAVGAGRRAAQQLRARITPAGAGGTVAPDGVVDYASVQQVDSPNATSSTGSPPNGLSTVRDMSPPTP